MSSALLATISFASCLTATRLLAGCDQYPQCRVLLCPASPAGLLLLRSALPLCLLRPVAGGRWSNWMLRASTSRKIGWETFRIWVTQRGTPVELRRSKKRNKKNQNKGSSGGRTEQREQANIERPSNSNNKQEREDRERAQKRGEQAAHSRRDWTDRAAQGLGERGWSHRDRRCPTPSVRRRIRSEQPGTDRETEKRGNDAYHHGATSG